MSEHLAIDAFQVRLVDIGAVDCAQLHALSIGVGWPHRAEDWAFLGAVGSGIAALDEIGRVLGSAMWFAQGERFATVGMVITSPRLQSLGTGRWLMERVLAACGGRDLRLNATRAARRLYLSLDFVPDRTVFQCQGEARVSPAPPLPEGGVLRALNRDDLPALIALDERAFGVARARLMARLLENSAGFGLQCHGGLAAFALCRRFGRGHVVGPVVAGSDAAAMAVVHPHVLAQQRRFLRVDTYHGSGAFSAFLAGAGLPVVDTMLTMARPRRMASTQADCLTYALASHTLG